MCRCSLPARRFNTICTFYIGSGYFICDRAEGNATDLSVQSAGEHVGEDLVRLVFGNGDEVKQSARGEEILLLRRAREIRQSPPPLVRSDTNACARPHLDLVEQAVRDRHASRSPRPSLFDPLDVRISLRRRRFLFFRLNIRRIEHEHVDLVRESVREARGQVGVDGFDSGLRVGLSGEEGRSTCDWVQVRSEVDCV